MNEHLHNEPARKARRRRLRREATDAERRMWRVSRARRMAGLKLFRQYGVGPYILDFCCPERRLAIEVDGGQHGDAQG